VAGYRGGSVYLDDIARRTGSEQDNEFSFVVDCSGSMRRNRIQQFREYLTLFIESFQEGSSVYLDDITRPDFHCFETWERNRGNLGGTAFLGLCN
jgi:hypothetical protein